MRPGKRGAVIRILGALMVAPLAGCIGGADDEDLGAAGAVGAASSFSDTAVFAGVYDTTGPYSRPLVHGIYDILAPEVVELESDVDGATIQMGIVRPDVPAGTRVPVIVDASPYYDPMTPERLKENPHRDQIHWWTYNHYDSFAANFVPHGYAVAFLATRGTADSGGCWTMFGPEERADVDQALTWLGEQEWSNGNVGMIGLSWEASSQWMAASTGNPHLKTVVPVVTSATDLYARFVRNGTGGASATFLAFYPYGMGIEGPGLVPDLADPVPGTVEAVTTFDPGDRSLEHRWQGALCPGAWEGIAATQAGAAGTGRTPPAFWAARNFQPGVASDYRGSILVANGLWDIGAMRSTYPFVSTLEDRGVVVKHVLGLWGHGYPDARIFAGDDETNRRWDWAEILLRWFDRWLKEDDTAAIGPAAQVQDTSGQWRSEPTWPPRDTTPMPWFLGPDGALTMTPGRNEALVDLATCPACGRFETEPFTSDLRFAGLPTLHATVTPRGPGGQLAAALSLVGPEGETLLGNAVMDLRYADGGEAPTTVTPGAPLVARMQFTPMDVHVPAGSSLALVITLSGAGGTPSLPPTPVELHVGADASVLTLRAFERGPEAFFEPPG